MVDLKKPTRAIPAPLANSAKLDTAELQQLAQKAQGPWKELTDEEIVKRTFVVPLCNIVMCVLFCTYRCVRFTYVFFPQSIGPHLPTHTKK